MKRRKYITTYHHMNGENLPRGKRWKEKVDKKGIYKEIKKYKLIKDIYELEGKEYEEIQKLNINLGYGYHGQSAEDILKERKKKK
jgi:hypothetical protein